MKSNFTELTSKTPDRHISSQSSESAYFNVYKGSKDVSPEKIQNKPESSLADEGKKLADISTKIQKVREAQEKAKGLVKLEKEIRKLEQDFKPFKSRFEGFDKWGKEIELLINDNENNNQLKLSDQESYEQDMFKFGNALLKEIIKPQQGLNSKQIEQMKEKEEKCEIYARIAENARKKLKETVDRMDPALIRLKGIRDKYTENIDIPSKDTYGDLDTKGVETISKSIIYAGHTSEQLTQINETNLEQKSIEAGKYAEMINYMGLLTGTTTDYSSEWATKNWQLSDEELTEAQTAVHFINLLDKLSDNHRTLVTSAVRFQSESVARFLTDTWKAYKELPKVKEAIDKHAPLAKAKQNLEKINKEIDSTLQLAGAGIDLGNMASQKNKATRILEHLTKSLSE